MVPETLLQENTRENRPCKEISTALSMNPEIQAPQKVVFITAEFQGHTGMYFASMIGSCMRIGFLFEL